MKNLLTIIIILISINCYSQVIRDGKRPDYFERKTRYTYYVESFSASDNICTYYFNPWNEHGMKFVFDVEVDWEYDIYIYGRLFDEDDWELIIRSKSSRIKYLDKFLYIREFKLVSKTGAFTRIKTKLFYE